jgi:hypothetical protein
MGQSLNASVIATGISRDTRLFRRANSYRIQVKTSDIRINIDWVDIQVIPRTRVRRDIPSEYTAAISAHRRREAEYIQLCATYGRAAVHAKLKAMEKSFLSHIPNKLAEIEPWFNRVQRSLYKQQE